MLRPAVNLKYAKALGFRKGSFCSIGIPILIASGRPFNLMERFLISIRDTRLVFHIKFELNPNIYTSILHREIKDIFSISRLLYAMWNMLIKEYRIPLPMTVEEYRIAQLYMIQVGEKRNGCSCWFCIRRSPSLVGFILCITVCLWLCVLPLGMGSSNSPLAFVLTW